MDKVLKPFISDNLPEFISESDDKFKLFIEAYYEFLEKRNDSESKNVKDLFKQLHNPGGIISNAAQYKDIDSTLDKYFKYFKNEVLPIAIETSKVKDRFLVKKIRDLYLAKGSPKSFELFFRMLYDEDIDLFETRENIIEASEGKYLAFPLVTFRVVNNASKLNDIDFTLAPISHSDDNFSTDSDIATSLSGQVLGKTGDSDKQQVIQVQLNFTYEFDSSQTYRITDQNDTTIFIDVKPMLSLTGITTKQNAPGYIPGDVIRVKSISANKNFNIIVDSVNPGSVTGIHFRDRGEFYKVNDLFEFSPATPGDGTGGTALISAVDSNGRITEVDGFKVRTGKLNNGFLADDFENVIVPITNGGSYRALPNLKITASSTSNQGLPYSKAPVSGQGAIFSPVSTNIGTIAKLNIFDRGYFNNASDISITAPMNIVTESPVNFDNGQVVSIQYLRQVNDSFLNDSDRIDITIRANKVINYDSDDLRYKIRTITLPIDFDSENFNWIDSEYKIDSDQGLSLATTSWKTKANRLNYEVTEDSDQGFKVRIYSKFINKLDSYHYNLLNNYKFNDSDYTFNWRNDFTDPRLGVDSEIAIWTNTGYFGLVNRIDSTKKNISIAQYENTLFPTDSDLELFDIPKNRILRVAGYNVATGKVAVRNKKPLTGVIASHNRARFEAQLKAFSESTKTFINEDGFLNSLSGGVIQDNYLYSNYTYIIQSNLSISLWRDKIKKTLHPAGMILLGETNLNQITPVNINVTAESSREVQDTKFTFDTALDHYSDPDLENRVTADNTRYESNSFLFYQQTNQNMYALRASNYERGYDEAIVSEYGTSWFDFEPVGLVRKEEVDYDGAYDSTLNYDSDELLKSVTSQDSDGSGYVKQLLDNFKKYNNTVQDFYKKESRTRRSYDPVQIASTKFIDPINELYNVYDSDLPVGFHLRWSDSESNVYRAIDYGRLKSTNDTRTFKWFNTDRKREMSFKKASDLNLAMRLDGTLTFKDQDGTEYKDIEAYERIWNEINQYRLDSEGWEINGYSSFIQNAKIKPRQLKVAYAERRTPDYQKVKTPFKVIVWDNLDSDNIIWNRHYQIGEDALLNNSAGTIFDWNSANANDDYEVWRDPITSMKGRKRDS